MAAPAGNEFWKLVAEPGRPRKYQPEELWNKAIEYFEWVNENPLFELKAFAYQGEITKEEMPKMRAMTEIAFCLYAGISQDTFENYKSGIDEYKDFFGVAKAIEQIIYTQKFEGASADLLNSNIIARDLGLTDKQQLEHKTPIPVIWNERTYEVKDE